MVSGSMSLDDFSKRFRMLEVRCGHCTRRGRLRIDKLIDEHGRDMSLPDMLIDLDIFGPAGFGPSRSSRHLAFPRKG